MDDDDEGREPFRPSDYFPADSCWPSPSPPPPPPPPMELRHDSSYFDDSILGELGWNLHADDHQEYRLGDLDQIGEGRSPSSSGMFPVPIGAGGGEAVAASSTAATATTTSSNQSEGSSEEIPEAEKDGDKPSPEIT